MLFIARSAFEQNKRKIYVSFLILAFALIYPLFADISNGLKAAKFRSTKTVLLGKIR